MSDNDIEQLAIEYFKINEPAVYAKYAKLFGIQLDRRREYNNDKVHIFNAFKAGYNAAKQIKQ